MFTNRQLPLLLIAMAPLLAAAPKVASADTSLPSAADTAAIVACGGRVVRSGATLRLTIARGSPVELTDDIDTGASNYNRYELLECADELGLFLVRVRHYESVTQMLLSQTSGQRFLIAGPIHLSASKRAFAVVEPFASGGESWDFGIDIFHQRPDGEWNETWQYRPTDFQGRVFLSWDGEDAVRIATATWKEGPLVVGHETVLRVSPLRFLREDGPESILRDEKGRYVDYIPGEQ